LRHVRADAVQNLSSAQLLSAGGGLDALL
jgi:hypothetical protein